MTRTDHFACPTPAFPVYSLAFISDADVVLGGGGGASRTGIANKLVRTAPVLPSLWPSHRALQLPQRSRRADVSH